MAQSVKQLTSAQVTVSWSVSSSPAWGSVLTAQSLEPVSDSVSPCLSDPPPFMLSLPVSKINKCWGAWVARLVKRLTSVRVMISRSVSSSPASGSVLAAHSQEPVLDSVSPSLSAPPLIMLCLSLSLSKINKNINFF